MYTSSLRCLKWVSLLQTKGHAEAYRKLCIIRNGYQSSFWMNQVFLFFAHNRARYRFIAFLQRYDRLLL